MLWILMNIFHLLARLDLDQIFCCHKKVFLRYDFHVSWFTKGKVLFLQLVLKVVKMFINQKQQIHKTIHMKGTNQSSASAASYQKRILIVIKETLHFTQGNFGLATVFTYLLSKCVKSRLFYPELVQSQLFVQLCQFSLSQATFSAILMLCQHILQGL